MSVRRTTVVPFQSSNIGSSHQLLFHEYGPTDGEAAYIQATLHADELPGLLVANNLIKLLDQAAARGEVSKKIIIVPYANPIGLSQNLLGKHTGRFAYATGTNFNREHIDVIKQVTAAVDGKLTKDDAAENVRIIRASILEETNKLVFRKDDQIMKKELFKVASQCDIVLDLHCDCNAVMHMYTHDRLWPQFSDLCIELQSHVQLLAANSGGNAFDESVSCIWAALADSYPECSIPMACQSSTVELRGENDVSDELASQDAWGLYRFLQGRGYLQYSEAVPKAVSSLKLLNDATSLDGVDMIEMTVPGVLVWRVKAGDVVAAGDLLGEIVNIADVDAPRTPIITRTAGVVYGRRSDQLARPGDTAIKVAGKESLEWRKGNLLTV